MSIEENKVYILMKRKLSSTSGEASDMDGNYGRSSLDEQAQLSSALELEQSTTYAEAGGFLLAPHLARSLGMRPGEMLFRSMFYGTPQAPHASELAAQLLKEQERLFYLQLGEGTSSSAQLSEDHVFDLMESNAAVIQALLDSVEAPIFAVAPAMAVGGVGATCGKEESSAQGMVVVGEGTMHHWQAPGVPEQSALDSDGGFILAPDLARLLGMQSGQALRRGMFYSTPQSDIVLGIVGQLSEMQKDLLHNQELERDGVALGGMGVGFEDTASLIAANVELMQALMGSIEAPAVSSEEVVVDSDLKGESEIEVRGGLALEEEGALDLGRVLLKGAELIEACEQEKRKNRELKGPKKRVKNREKELERYRKKKEMRRKQRELNMVERQKKRDRLDSELRELRDEINVLIAEEKALKIKAEKLVIEISKAEKLEESGASGSGKSRVSKSDKSERTELEERLRKLTKEEIELELDSERDRERLLGLELDRVRSGMPPLDREMGLLRVKLLGGPKGNMEGEMGRKKMKEMSRDAALARVRGLELDLEILKVRARLRALSSELESRRVMDVG